MQPPAWAGIYVGIPYVEYGRARAGLDCWGLVRLVLAERAGILLPAYSTDPSDHAAVRREIDAAKRSPTWRKVPAGAVQALDVAEIATPTRAAQSWEFVPLHVGIVAGNGWLLHAERSTGAVLVRLGDPSMARRIEGFWRYAA